LDGNFSVQRTVNGRGADCFQGSICYVAGPPTNGSAARQVFIEAGVNEDDVRTEDFAGY
jgi:hypothetical protein